MHDNGAKEAVFQSPGLNSSENVHFRRNLQNGPRDRYLSHHGCFPSEVNKIATWNVEGFSYKDGFSMKLEELTRWMLLADVGILCMQDTHMEQAEHFLYNGFLIILSGSEGAARSFAGVGFLVAPWMPRSVGFLPAH